MKTVYSTILFILFSFSVFGQDIIISPERLVNSPELGAKFRRCEEYQLDIKAIQNQLAVKSQAQQSIEMELNLNNRKVKLQFFEYNMFKPTAKLRTSPTPNAPVYDINPSIRTFRGSVFEDGGGIAALTIADNYFLLAYKVDGETYYLEPTMINQSMNTNGRLTFYEIADIIPVAGVYCGAEQVEKFGHDHDPSEVKPNDSRNKACFDVPIALACDYKFVRLTGSVPMAEAVMTGFMNLTQTDWEGQDLQYEYFYGITDLFAPDDILRDPWATTTDIFTHLNIFQMAGPVIFSGGYAVATAWTFNYTSGAVGVAFLDAVCTGNRYNVCSNFSGSSNICRQTQSHELGHNFSAQHDAPGGYIMDPSVNGSTIWSIASNQSIKMYTDFSAGCLLPCSTPNAVPEVKFKATPSRGCRPLVVQFTNQSTYGVTYAWEFPGGSPATSTAVNPVVTYTNKGVYEVTLEVRNPRCGTKKTFPAFIEVIDVPLPNFSYGNAGGDLFFEFFDGSVGGEKWEWNFGDGSPKEEGEYVIHEFKKEGNYDVELTVTNECGSTKIKKKVAAFAPVFADFEADTTWGCAEKVIKFKDLSSNNVSNWTWDCPGGTPSGSALKNPIIKYTRPGIYKVKLTANSTKFSSSRTKEMYITIDSLPIAAFTSNTKGFIVDFTNQSTNAKSHTWNFGDGSNLSTDPNPTHTFKEGVYDVTYTATNLCGNTIVKSKLTIYNTPVPSFTTKTQHGCIPFTVNFENTSSVSSTDFVWSFPGGTPSTSTDRDPVVVYNSIGTFDVKLVATNSQAADSITSTQYITVEDLPVSNFQSNVTGFSGFFTNNSINGTKYLWDFGDGKGTSTLASPNYNYGVEGEFTVKLTVENGCGVSTFEQLIAVYLIPKVNFSSDVIRGCAPLKVNFQNKSSVDVNDWSWQFEGGSPLVSTTANPVVTFNKQGKYTVKLTVKNNNGSNASTKIKYIEVISPVLCPDRPKKKGPKISEIAGFYDQELDERASLSNTVNIYPNPANDLITIEGAHIISYSLVNLAGKELASGQTNGNITSVNISHIESGAYFIKVRETDDFTIRKITIAR